MMKIFSRFFPGILALLTAVFLSAALFLADPFPLTVLRNAVFDQYQRWHPRPYRTDSVRIVDIDGESLKRLGQWPWPRTRLAELIQRLQKDGAAVVSLDMVLAEADRTSPKLMTDAWNLSGDLRRRLESLPDHDKTLAGAIGRGRVVLGFTALPDSAARPLPARHFRLVFSGASPVSSLPSYPAALTSLAPLENAAEGNGILTFIPDPDGVVRRIPLMVAIQDHPVPSLAAESLRVAQRQRNYIIKTSPQPGTGIGEVRIGNLTAPTTPTGEIWVHYTRPVPERYLPAWKVLEGLVPRETLEGRILLVGSSAQGLMDLRFSPMGQLIPGVEIHAQAIEQILDGAYLKRPAWAGTLETLTIVLGGLIIGFVALAAAALVSAAITLAALIALCWGAWVAFVRFGLLLDPLTPGLAIFITFIVGSVVHHRISERRQRWIREAFSRYVSPNRVEYLVDHPDQLELGGRRQECSFLFTDLTGFTSLMETMDPGEAVSILNPYLDGMIRIAFRHGGTLDRIVGDAVAIMFSAPVAQPDHPRRALSCALEMHDFARSYAKNLNDRGIPFGQTRIGIHTGEVIVGNFGGSSMFDYRALGDTVNTASRLESANKYLGTLLCLSENTLARCPQTPARPVGSLLLKGKTKPLKVYEPVTGPANKDDRRCPDVEYAKAFDLLQNKNPLARQAFEKLAEKWPQDPLVLLHLKRLREGKEDAIIILEGK